MQTEITSFGAAIRARREELGLSQARLARLAGLSRATINAFEAGATDLGVAKVVKIAHLMGLRVDILGEPLSRRGWLEVAAGSASVSYATSMPPEVLARAIRTGAIDERYSPHLATFLDEAPAAVLVKAVAAAYPGPVPAGAWRNIARMAKATLCSRPELS